MDVNFLFDILSLSTQSVLLNGSPDLNLIISNFDRMVARLSKSKIVRNGSWAPIRERVTGSEVPSQIKIEKYGFSAKRKSWSCQCELRISQWSKNRITLALIVWNAIIVVVIIEVIRDAIIIRIVFNYGCKNYYTGEGRSSWQLKVKFSHNVVSWKWKSAGR